ncbi:aminopeptidase M1-A-like [Formica exsecta]|uniref:aminopeptidase M1-A-like n=1 Tax=Formica exsecta TaxID=72781 RepID=UPI0011446451|nr:aminopeptidase M1-A-like [Formica exsecta]XP_029666442.1 aminopeptidase M1-A-like [Formica exsecta]
MILLKLLISSGLIFMTATAFYPDEASSKLLNYIKPKHYDIKLIPFIEGQIFYGESNISINILYETQHINLYSEKLCISSMLLNANLEESDKENKYIVYKPIYTQNIETPILDIYFKDKLPPGNYTLNIKYTGSVANDGGLEIFSVGGHNKNITWLAATIFRATGARRLFPGWDKPDLKATFNISVMHYNQYMVLSNMPVQRMENRQHKMMWTYFDITPAMSTYLATIIMTDLYRIYSTSGDVSMWCRLYTASHLMFAADVAGNITLFLENEWKRFPNISKAEHVAFPNFEKEIMVHLGIILYR